MEKLFKTLKTILSVLLIVFGVSFLAYKGYDKYKNQKLNKEVSAKSDNLYKDIIGENIELNKVLADNGSEKKKENKEKKVEYNNYIKALNEEFSNKDIIARIVIPKIGIDYMVVKSHDNEDYLFKDINGNYSENGSIFLDKDCDEGFTDFNSIIYGHKMADGQMFGKLNKYLDDEFVNNGEDNIFKIITNNGEKTYRIISSMVIDNNQNVIKNINKEEFIKEISEKSDIVFDKPEINDKSRFVTLITCFPRNGVIDEERRIAIVGVEI